MPLSTSSLDKRLSCVRFFQLFLLKGIILLFLELERDISMGPVEFVSSLGGLFGLFLGFSVVSFLEIVYWATVRMCRNIVWEH